MVVHGIFPDTWHCWSGSRISSCYWWWRLQLVWQCLDGTGEWCDSTILRTNPVGPTNRRWWWMVVRCCHRLWTGSGGGSGGFGNFQILNYTGAGQRQQDGNTPRDIIPLLCKWWRWWRCWWRWTGDSLVVETGGDGHPQPQNDGGD